MSAPTLLPATPDHAEGISDMLQTLVAAGKRTARADLEFVLAHYITPPARIACTLAVQGDRVLGLQSLQLATPGNAYGTPVGWGIIGTHIHPKAARRGIGKALFATTLNAARGAGLSSIEALIGAENAEGLAYYEAMGFRSYREAPGAVGKQFVLSRT